MTEVLEPFPRAWAEFPDPEQEDVCHRVDLTWLTSRWECLFGRGCPGILTDSPTSGCCALGAHLCDEDDVARVSDAVNRLGSAGWVHHEAALAQGWLERDSAEDGTQIRRTRVVDGACILHNPAGFPGGEGCALHHLAVREGVPFTRTKPDVCWQLPLRRTYRTLERADGSSMLEVTIGEYTREGWGAGGADLDWYCSSHPRAHHGRQPVWMACRDELIELTSPAVYAVIESLCEEFDATRLCRHPADPQM